MTQVILDTSFILTCVKQKIDFFEELKFMGLKVLIPEQVVRELKNMKSPNAELALKLLSKNKFEKIDLKIKNVDEGIKQCAKTHPDVFVATLDRELKKLDNSCVVIREKKRLEII